VSQLVSCDWENYCKCEMLRRKCVTIFCHDRLKADFGLVKPHVRKCLFRNYVIRKTYCCRKKSLTLWVNYLTKQSNPQIFFIKKNCSTDLD
jgi:hypothetical protein